MRIAAVLLFTLSLHAQQIDFARIFPPREQQSLEFREALARLNKTAGRVASDPERAIERYNDVLRTFERLDAFLYLQYAIDTTNTAARNAEEELTTEFETRTASFVREVATAKPPKRYRWFVESLRTRQADDPLATGWQSELHDLLDSDPRPASEKRALYAFTLIRLARAGNARARQHGQADAASAAYASSNLTKADVTRLLDAVAGQVDCFRRYQTLRRGGAPLASPPQFTLEEARSILPAATSPAGTAYAAELSHLLDPAAGRIDVVGGEHRKRGGFSKGFPGFPSVFFMSAFRGTYNDLRIIAHESTHAVQRQLEADRNVPPVYIDGPKYLAESYAMFNELLLPEYLAARESDPARKAFYLEQFLESKGLAIVFLTAAEAYLEQEIYDGVANGTLNTADDLDEVSKRVAARYALPQERVNWMSVRLMYDDPFYDVNYTLAGLIALTFHARSRDDPAHFLPAYANLIANGYTEAPDALLQRLTNVRIRDPHFVSDAFASVDPAIDQLQQLYNQR